VSPKQPAVVIRDGVCRSVTSPMKSTRSDKRVPR
jgi:hypothetical protein